MKRKVKACYTPQWGERKDWALNTLVEAPKINEYGEVVKPVKVEST